MRIAQVAPLFVRISAHQYGGTERVVHALGQELSRRGEHELVLFGPGTSEWPGELVQSRSFRSVSSAAEPAGYRQAANV